MKTAEANALVSAVTSWAIGRDDICAMALAGSWARGNPRQVSDRCGLSLSVERERDLWRRLVATHQSAAGGTSGIDVC